MTSDLTSGLNHIQTKRHEKSTGLRKIRSPAAFSIVDAARQVSASTGIAMCAGASMIAALVLDAQAHLRGIEATYAAWWVGALMSIVPLLHVRPGTLGHGTRALGLIALVPVVAATTSAAITRSLTASWMYLCGMGFVGVLALPIISGALVACGLGLLLGLARRGLLRPVAIVSCALVLPIACALGLALCTAESAPTAAEWLLRDVRTIAPLPPLETLGEQPVDIGGSRVARVCRAQDCDLVIDGIEAELPPTGPLEIADGLGHRFVRPVGSDDPTRWLAFRPGAAYGVQLEAADLDRRIAAPPGLGVVFAAAAAFSLLYSIAGLSHAVRLARLRHAVPAHVVQRGTLRVAEWIAPCDASIPVGPALLFGAIDDVATYRARAVVRGAVRAGDRETLVDAEWHALSEHCAMVAALLTLGAMPLLVALRAGLALGP
jgi:hypothetical protein